MIDKLAHPLERPTHGDGALEQFFKYLAGFFYRPRHTARLLFADPNALYHGLAALLLIAFLYSLTLAALYYSPIECCITEPYLRIPAERYWLVSIIWEVPLMFILAILPAALVEIMTHRHRRESDFKLLLAGMGFILIVVQLLNMWLPETIFAIVGSNTILPDWLGMLRVNIFVPWGIFLLTIIVREIKQVSWLRAAIVSTIAFVPGVILAFVFVR